MYTEESLMKAQELLDKVARGEVSASMSGLEYYTEEVKVNRLRQTRAAEYAQSAKAQG